MDILPPREFGNAQPSIILPWSALRRIFQLFRDTCTELPESGYRHVQVALPAAASPCLPVLRSVGNKSLDGLLTHPLGITELDFIDLYSLIDGLGMGSTEVNSPRESIRFSGGVVDRGLKTAVRV